MNASGLIYCVLRYVLDLKQPLSRPAKRLSLRQTKLAMGSAGNDNQASELNCRMENVQ